MFSFDNRQQFPLHVLLYFCFFPLLYGAMYLKKSIQHFMRFPNLEAMQKLKKMLNPLPNV